MVRNLDSFQGLLGWRPLPEVTLDAENELSETGRYYNDFSALVTTSNIYYTQPDPEISDDDFNDYLRVLVDSSIQQLMNSVFRRNDDLIENKLLYPYEFDFNHPLENESDFVGFEIYVSKKRDLVTVLNSVSLTFDGVTDVKLLLFHSSKKAPIQNKTIATLENDTKTEVLDWVLDKSEGKYYLGYLTSGLTAKAYDRNFELASLKNCFSASRFIDVKIKDWDSETLFNVSTTQNVAFSWGLNFDISTWKDWTNVVSQNKSKFIDAIGMQVCVNALDLFLNSGRSNTNERIAKANIMVALDGYRDDNGFFTQGLRKRLDNEIKELRKLFIDQPLISIGTLS